MQPRKEVHRDIIPRGSARCSTARDARKMLVLRQCPRAARPMRSLWARDRAGPRPPCCSPEAVTKWCSWTGPDSPATKRVAKGSCRPGSMPCDAWACTSGSSRPARGRSAASPTSLRRARPGVHVRFPIPPAGGAPEGLGVRRTSFDEVLVDAVRRQPHTTVREAQRVTGLSTTVAARSSVSPRRPAYQGPHRRRCRWAALAGACLGRLGPIRQARLRYGLAGHWRVDTRDRDAVTVTLAGDHEWYEAPVGPDLLLVSILTHRSSPPMTARTYAAAARRSIAGLRDAELVAGPLGAAHFHQRVRAVADGAHLPHRRRVRLRRPHHGDGIAIGMLVAERLAVHVGELLSGRISSPPPPPDMHATTMASFASAAGSPNSRSSWRDRRC